MLMLFIFATFGLNFPIYISTMAVGVFHADAGAYGLLSSAMAVGSVSGALLSAGRAQPRFTLLVLAAAVFGAGCGAAALMPNQWLFAAVLAVLGVAAQTFNTTTNTLVQLGTEPSMRGRVMAILLALLLGGTPLGAPLIGHVADSLGPRWAMGVGALAGLVVAAIGGLFLRRVGSPSGPRLRGTPG
jgi:MFS family permease